MKGGGRVYAGIVNAEPCDAVKLSFGTNAVELGLLESAVHVHELCLGTSEDPTPPK